MPRFSEQNYAQLWTKLIDVIKTIQLLPRFEIILIDVMVAPSTTTTIPVTSNRLDRVRGMLQISATTSESPIMAVTNNTTCEATYTFGADTTGRHNFTFLMIGD